MSLNIAKEIFGIPLLKAKVRRGGETVKVLHEKKRRTLLTKFTFRN